MDRAVKLAAELLGYRDGRTVGASSVDGLADEVAEQLVKILDRLEHIENSWGRSVEKRLRALESPEPKEQIDPDTVRNGLYRVTFISGESSVGCVYRLADGRPWFVAVGQGEPALLGEWTIDRLERIETD